MFGMTLLSSIRYLASTCAYTAVMVSPSHMSGSISNPHCPRHKVLINAMTPPHLVPLANGLAQSAVSLARFIGTPARSISRQTSAKHRSQLRPFARRHAVGCQHPRRAERAPLPVQLRGGVCHCRRESFLTYLVFSNSSYFLSASASSASATRSAYTNLHARILFVSRYRNLLPHLSNPFIA